MFGNYAAILYCDCLDEDRAPRLNSVMIRLLNAERSWGPRLVISPSSSTTALFTQLAPALIRSVFTDGHEVTFRPCTTPASMSIHGPWQIDTTGLPASKK